MRCWGPPGSATSAACSRPVPSTPAGIDSRELLAAVVARLADGGLAAGRRGPDDRRGPAAAGGHLDAMRAAIAGLLALEPDAVNVKASTGNLDGSEGAGRSISTLALATIEARS